MSGKGVDLDRFETRCKERSDGDLIHLVPLPRSLVESAGTIKQRALLDEQLGNLETRGLILKPSDRSFMQTVETSKSMGTNGTPLHFLNLN